MPEQIVVVGNVVADAELRFLPNGAAVANFTVADTPRVKGQNDEWKDGDTIWWRVSAWRDLAENVTESLRKGTRVVVIGTPKQTNWEKDGVKFSRIELTATEVAASMKWATVSVTKAPSKGGGGGSSSGGGGNYGGGFSGQDDEPPF